MKRVLVPIDGSVRSAAAITYLIDLAASGERNEVVVLNVQPTPKRRQMGGLATKVVFDRLRMLGEVATSHSMERLRAADLPHRRRLEIGDNEIDAIVRAADEEACDEIVMAGNELHPLARRFRQSGMRLFRSLADRVIDRTDLPVLVVQSAASGRIECREFGRDCPGDGARTVETKHSGPKDRLTIHQRVHELS